KGEALAPASFRLGCGSTEIGPVTPRPRRGNERPRLFRLVSQRAIINRMGFNNAGAGAVAGRLRRLPPLPGPICINVGRNKETPNERAAEDYVTAFRTLAPHAQLVSINVSSPNTPGLRALQSDLSNLVGEVARARDALPRRVPVLVKLSPDEPDDRLAEMAKAAQAAGADGIIATNTTVDRGPVVYHPRAVAQARIERGAGRWQGRLTTGMGVNPVHRGRDSCVVADDRRREDLRDVFARLLRQLLHPVQVPEVALLLAEAAGFSRAPAPRRRSPPPRPPPVPPPC